MYSLYYLHSCPSEVNGSTQPPDLVVVFSIEEASLWDMFDGGSGFWGCRGALLRFTAYFGIL